MKRIIGLLISIVALPIMLISCGKPVSLQNMEYIRHEDGTYGDQIKWGDNVYTIWSATGTELIDKQIGIAIKRIKSILFAAIPLKSG